MYRLEKALFTGFITFCIFISLNSAVFAAKKNTKTPINNQFHALNFVPYNQVPGDQDVNLGNLQIKREVTGTAVISPDMRKVAYTKTFFYPMNLHTAGKLFYINPGPLDFLDDLNKTLTPAQLSNIFKIEKADNPGIEIMSAGTENFDNHIFRTLTIVDWSQDSRKILIKEAVGEHYRGIWRTNLWVYDFSVKKAKRLDEVRNAVVFYWKKKYKSFLNDYRWDIVPLGWDYENPDIIIVNAYGYNKYDKEFLGCWGVDYRGRRVQLLSQDIENRHVGQNGMVLVEK